MATARSTVTARTARSTVKWSPRKPIRGGPAKNAQYPMEAITLTRGAAIAASSAPALIRPGIPRRGQPPEHGANERDHHISPKNNQQLAHQTDHGQHSDHDDSTVTVE